MSELGASGEIVDAILNHKKKGVIGTYNRNKYDKEKQKWLIKWSQHLEKLMTEKKLSWVVHGMCGNAMIFLI